MSFILRFFGIGRRKTTESRLINKLKGLKGMEFVLLSRLDGLPVAIVSKRNTNVKVVAATMASLAAMSRQAMNMLYRTEIRSIQLIMEDGLLIVLIRPPLMLSVLAPKEKTDQRAELMKKAQEIFNEINEVLA